MFLTSDEVIALTGAQRPTAQARWLSHNGYRDGRAEVTAAVEGGGDCGVDRETEESGVSNQDKEPTIEQQARDLLKQMGIEDWLSSGDSDQDQIQDLPARNLSPLMNLMEENKRLREEKVALISAKAVTINPPAMPESEMIDYLRQTIDRQNQDIARLRDEGQKDYDGMREFQRKFIDASHEAEHLREELLTRHAEARKQAEEIERLRDVIKQVRELLDDGTLIRDTSNDWDSSIWLNQGLRITKMVAGIREALGHE